MYFFENFSFLSLVIMRMTGLVILNPILGRESILTQTKSSLILVLSALVFISVEPVNIEFVGIFDYAIILLKEFLAGFAVGFVINLFSFAIILAGDMIDMQMGLSMAKMYDEQSGSSIALSATLYNVMFMLFFFAVDAHVYMMRLILYSHEAVPYGQVFIGEQVLNEMITLFMMCMDLGIRLAFPITSMIYLSSLGMGMLMKTIPQINVFVVDIQLKIFIGFMVLIMFLTPASEYLKELIDLMMQNFAIMFEVLNKS